MLPLALILFAIEVMLHASLALLHGWPPASLSHEARERLVGLHYAGIAGVLLIGALAYAH